MTAPGCSAVSNKSLYYLGLDCGATHLRARAFSISPRGDLEPAGPLLIRRFPTFDGLPPGPLRPALGEAPLSPAEEQAGATRLQMAIELAAEAAGNCRPVGMAVAWAGLKCPAGESLAYAHYGPRIPNLRSRLEDGLLRLGLKLSGPIPPLQSDGDMAGWGEEADAVGGFRGYPSAYLLQAGTGLAEAFKFAGQPCTRATLGLQAPYAMDVPPPLSGNYEYHLCAGAWSNELLTFEQRFELLGIFLRSRLEQVAFSHIVLGGRFRQILGERDLSQLAPATPISLSQVIEAPVLGCAAFLRSLVPA